VGKRLGVELGDHRGSVEFAQRLIQEEYGSAPALLIVFFGQPRDIHRQFQPATRQRGGIEPNVAGTDPFPAIIDLRTLADAQSRFEGADTPAFDRRRCGAQQLDVFE